ncbi:hypothetical protein THAOC_29465 [Thalassiosira oceanica]|uniref:Uncharacterized protein n=1 Tax=Thalassiosira oceanica TaxID=159749 RepID=K0RDR9_THAOC|nr:hypothetical protein THAOC_29465 [Thalassiosira oceanica]|eukprot:EJK51365.1 hypothetical protein THAOC_29465 [Thalassiosira oceanica]
MDHSHEVGEEEAAQLNGGRDEAVAVAALVTLKGSFESILKYGLCRDLQLAAPILVLFCPEDPDYDTQQDRLVYVSTSAKMADDVGAKRLKALKDGVTIAETAEGRSVLRR